MRRTTLTMLAALAMSVAAPGQTAKARQSPRRPGEALQVHVNLVTVPVTVLDRDGRMVGGLSRKDFALTEDGRPQTIRLFQVNAAQPLAIVFAIDTSISVRRDLPLAKQAAYEFALSLLRRDDHVELLGFAGEVTQVVPFTDQLRALDRGLHNLHADGPTALYAAIAQAATDLENYPGRKVIVVISDGSNSVPGVDYEQARIAVLRAQASIASIILVPIEANAGRDLGGEHALIQLSSDTGGEYFYADNADRMRDAMTRISLGLRSEYLLGYYPAQTIESDARPDGFRKIHLQMTNPVWNRRYRLQYRTGYYVGPAR